MKKKVQRKVQVKSKSAGELKRKSPPLKSFGTSGRPAPKTAKKAPKKLRTRTRGLARVATNEYNLSPNTRETHIRAGQNIMELLGGREAVIGTLQESAHPKVQSLIDRLRSKIHIGENFATSYTSVGLKAVDILEIFGDVAQARVFITAMNEGDEIMRSLMRAAKDQIESHDKCAATGKVINRKTGEPTDSDCGPCEGTGVILRSGSRESQQLYFELINWKKQGGLISIDARKQNMNFGAGATVYGVAPGGVPEITNLIKRAEDVRLLGPVGSSTVTKDDVIEAETI